MSPVAPIALVMTSREIAELTGKEHKHVLRDIRVMLSELALEEIGYAQNWTDPQNGQSYRMLALPKDLTTTLVAGYSVVMRHRIVQRWQELEAQVTLAIPNFADPAAAARAWACEFEEKRRIEALASQQAEQLALAAPKVDFAEAVLNSDGTLLVRDVAKTIGVPVRKLEKALRDKKVILSSNAPAAEFVSKGYFKETFHPYQDGKGNEKFKTVARVTGKGVEFLRRFSRKHIEVGEPA